MNASFSMELKTYKAGFFDRPWVKRVMDGANFRSLSKAGGFIRKTARWSIRPRKRISRPGEPPSSHTGRLRTGILYAYDRMAGSVVIGPMKFNQKVNPPVPNVLEFGGQERIKEKWTGRAWVSLGRRTYPGQQTRTRVARYAPRPYMGPALAVAKAKLPGYWRSSLRAA